jgi:hypothetical protein
MNVSMFDLKGDCGYYIIYFLVLDEVTSTTETHTKLRGPGFEPRVNVFGLTMSTFVN